MKAKWVVLTAQFNTSVYYTFQFISSGTGLYKLQSVSWAGSKEHCFALHVVPTAKRCWMSPSS